VIKADGLAAGRACSLQRPIKKEQAVTFLLSKGLGEAATAVLEEFLKGTEATFMVFTDGKTASRWSLPGTTNYL
jgi:phosphoribosylamine--glycine ligase